MSEIEKADPQLEKRPEGGGSGRRKADTSWSDRALVDACLAGDGVAWSALVDKYKRLIYSIILKYGANPEEASDLFQSVWLDAFNDLGKLRKRDSAKAWLISMTSHKCYHWKKKLRRRQQHEVESEDLASLGESAAVEPTFVAELEQQQVVREAILRLPERCRDLIHQLFFTFPPKPYKEVAKRLGLAVGSIGFIRGRCLAKLEKELERLGL